jgi:hypothetical protein
MPDARRHRGAHPDDPRDFAPTEWPRLSRACAELSWLFSHGYAETASLKLVGDHHQLRERQRRAVLRAACSDVDAAERRARRRELEQLRGAALGIDGFNCLITLEALLSAAPVFSGRDGALRDLASVHGTYRHVEETRPALDALRGLLEAHGVAAVRMYLDRPVGNSGRLRGLVEEVFAGSPCRLSTRLCDSVDGEIVAAEPVVASSDSWIIQRAAAWVDLPATFARQLGSAVWRVPLDGCLQSTDLAPSSASS